MKTPRLHHCLSVTASVAALLLNACTTLDVDGKQAAAAAQAVQAVADKHGASLDLAASARKVGDYRAAAEIYNQALARDPANAAVRAELGATQLEAGAIYDAIETYGRIDLASPQQIDAQLGIERAYLMLSQPADALEHAEKALALAPNNARALIGRGVALDTLRRHGEAQAAYRAALAIVPHDPGATSNLALSLALSGSYDEGIRLLTPIVRSPAVTARLRQNLALIYGLKGDHGTARALNRTDNDAAATEANVRFYALARQLRAGAASPN
jgi:Flp pilus assembly protein TadD